MAKTNSTYNQLLKKLDGFIRKYYLNQIIRGSIYFFGILLASYLLLTLTEFLTYLSITLRTLLFWSFISIHLALLFLLIIRPAIKYFNLGNKISHSQAATILGNHFPDIQDKLLNTLELTTLAEKHPEKAEIILASIDQRIEKFKPIPFTLAIDLGKNKKYLKYALTPLLLILVILFASPNILIEGSERIIRYNQYFEKPAPFNFIVQNQALTAIHNADLSLKVRLEGEELPAEVYVLVSNTRYKLKKVENQTFEYKFTHLQEDLEFQLFANGFYSKPYEIKILPNPVILNFETSLIFPRYTGLKTEKLNRVGDLTVPEGTQINWTYTTSSTETILFIIDSTTTKANKTGKNSFENQLKAFKSNKYTLLPIHNNSPINDSLTFYISVMKDAFPSISMEEKRDSLSEKQLYFAGQVADDYGFTRLTFNYKNLGETDVKVVSEKIEFNANGKIGVFFHYFDFNQTEAKAGDQIEYYFTIYDNDGVNGSKATQTKPKKLYLPTKEELKKSLSQNSDNLESQLNENIKEAKELQQELKKLSQKLMGKKELTFEDRKSIENMLDKQKNLRKDIQETVKQQKKLTQQKKDNLKQNEQILEKQKKLEELFENVLDEETQKLMEELQKLLEKQKPEQTQEQLNEMQMDNQQLEKELDRMLELFKQLEFEDKMQQTIDELNDLAKKEEDLSNQSKKEENKSAEIKKEQDKLNEEFENIKKDLEELDKKNQEMESPNDFDNPKEDQETIEKEMQKSSDQLENKQNKKAGESQGKAAEDMKSLAAKMSESLQQMQGEAISLNIKALREILENLIQVSFDQEKLMTDVKNTSTSDPNYLTLTQQQFKLKDDLKMIEDSVFALSKRVVEIETFVNKEIGEINLNLSKAIADLANRKKGNAASRQQYVMTSVNNLSLLLSEILDNMQMQMKAQQQGSGQSSGKEKGKNKGSGKGPNISKIKQMQDQLNKQISDLKNGQQNGQKDGKGEGKGEGQGQNGTSEQLSKLATQQQQIRNALEQLNREQNKDGKGGLGDLEKLGREMEKTESDLINKQLTEQTLLRQEEILTRLLESEKAQREREFDNKRESKEGENKKFDYNAIFDDYQKQQLGEVEFLKTIPASLKPFYKDKINNYFKKIGPS
jgi:hypothetical protein